MKIKLFTLLLSLMVMTAAAQQRIIDEKTMQKMLLEREQILKERSDNAADPSKSVFSLQQNSSLHTDQKPIIYRYPETGQVLSWDNGNLYTAIGGNALDLDVAIRFEPSDLQNLAGYFLTAIQVFTFDEMDFTLKVWQGPLGNNGEIYAQDVDEFIIGELNTFELNTPVAIDVTQEFWIGYTASFETGSYPLGTDTGPAVQFKGDLIRLSGGVWESMSQSYGIDFNWIIRGQAEVLADLQAPANPGNLIAEAAPEGGLSAAISWVNPSETFGGDPLTELTEIFIERNNEVIATIEDPEIGSQASFEDNTIAESGSYSYKIYGVNSFGNGPVSVASAYIGEDIPAAPTNAQLTVEGNDGLVTWEAPAQGINGGYINQADVFYSVKRFPGEVVVAQDLSATEFLDTQIPGPGNYFYKITAANQLGQGGTATSNVAVLGAEGYLMYETFDYPNGQLPPGWTITGAQAGWSVIESAYAGGQPNELRLHWLPATTGLSRLVTYPISTGSEDFYRVRLKQMYDGFYGSAIDEKIAIDISFDDGDTWENLWEYDAIEDFPAAEFQFPLSIPEQATTMYLGFRFEGNSFNIDNWYLDDILIEPLLDNDLEGLTITGPKTVSEGIAANYVVSIQNIGSVSQDDYTVKLMKNGTEEIASITGNSIDPAEVQSYELSWTPTEGDIGNVSLSGYVEFAGDELPSNNFTNVLNVEVFPEGILPVQIGEDDFYTSLPYDFSWEYSLSQTLYYPEEIGVAGGAIFALGYQADFGNSKLDKSIQIWMGETDREDLTDGWVDPSTLQLVFDGQVDFPAGQNDIIINLDQPYVYTGGNLVVYSYKPDDSWSFGNHFANSFDDARQRSLKLARDFTPYDPANPPAPHQAWLYYPNTTLFLNLSGLGSVAGIVTDGANALEGVKVTLSGVAQPAFTDATGGYEFPAVIAGTYSAQFELFGFQPLLIENVVVEEDGQTIQNAILAPIPQYTVTGSVEGNDGNLIEGAEITLEGYTPNTGYTAVSQADGAFTIEDVYEGMYLISVNAFGYEPYTADSIFVNENLDLGVILLDEQIEAPFNLMVMNEGLEPGQALFSWNNPLTGWAESFEEGFLPDQWSQIVNNSGSNAGLPATWTITGPVNIYNTTINPQDGNYQVFMMWDFSEQDEWLITKEFTVPAGDLNFWYFGTNGSTFGDNYFVKISTDNGQSWDILWNASNLPFGQNYYQEPVSINLDMYAGQKARIAWHNEDGPNNFGMWYYWAIDNITIGDAALNLTELMTVSDPQNEGLSDARPLANTGQVTTFGPEDLNGFNVFLNGEQVGAGVTSTQFLFDGLADGEYTAGVQAVFTTGVSEIAEIDFVVDDTRLLALVANPAGSGTLLGASWYQPGAQVLVSATAEDDYEFVNWTYENGDIVSEESAFFFTMPDEDIILVANFTEFEAFALTFSIDMSNAEGLDPEDGMVNITGSMHSWAVLGGVARDQALMQVDNSIIYTITMMLPPGDYEYAYFMNSGEHSWEWEEIPNREITLNGDMEVFDIWGLTTNIDAPQQETVNLFPNPFNEQIMLHDAGWATRVVITNLMGNEILNEPLSGDRINTSNLSSGVYLVFLYGDDGKQVVRKMIK
jgi:hypothetical protein